ncbi:MAG TPA: TRAP transporter small permease [Spirochaetota bacterium]|nr:TRAP transporter small permease [Spirochaetota bacterium]
MLKVWKTVTDIYKKIETSLLIFFLTLIIVVSGLQIVLRNFFQAVDWFDTFLKYLVLWVGMIAAGIATYQNKHIKIDLIGRLAKGRKKSIIYGVANFFASVVCFILFIVFINYIVRIEFPSADPPPFLGIKRWILLIILPISFLTMAIRFSESGVHNIYNFVKNIPEIDNEIIKTEKIEEQK